MGDTDYPRQFTLYFTWLDEAWNTWLQTQDVISRNPPARIYDEWVQGGNPSADSTGNPPRVTLGVSCPLTGARIDSSITTFVDDIAKMHVFFSSCML